MISGWQVCDINPINMNFILVVSLCSKLVSSAVRAKTNRQTDRQTDRWTLPSALSPCFAKATRSIINGVFFFFIDNQLIQP